MQYAAQRATLTPLVHSDSSKIILILFDLIYATKLIGINLSDSIRLIWDFEMLVGKPAQLYITNNKHDINNNLT